MVAPEPIAVVGMACRFAGGVDSPESFWEMLRAGRDAVGDLPPERWDWYAAQGREHAAAVAGATHRGAFLDDVAGFDADFFGITPREATLMDPQQRMILELAWESLEHAGIPPAGLAGTDTGVYIGVGADDYGRRMLEDLPRIEAWTGVGGGYCGVANRVSHLLDLRGPSVALDTACSSSLVAIHLAAQALRAGECPVALAGGVLVIAAPGLSLVLDAAGATAPDGRSKAFDAAADGYGRGEGGAVVVLKRLADARNDGDRVLAVIRGSAVRQDGRTEGIMAPSGPAQAHLLRRAYASAGVDPAAVGYVEAHGTGTPAGDPLEAAALSEVLAAGRPADRPLLIGSVKSNIGHLEAGAGVAGLIKTVLALRHRSIPASLHLHTPTPAVAAAGSGLRVVTAMTPWPETDGPRLAGVSGYGYGGTIAHLVVESGEEAGDGDGDDDDVGRPEIYRLCGASAEAVTGYAARLADRLAAAPAPGMRDIGHTLAVGRQELPYRAALVATSRAELIERLRALPDVGRAATTTGVVWVFSGHGSQWSGMGRELLRDEPVFAATLAELDPVFRAEAGWSPTEALLGLDEHPVDVIQPLIFAVQVALAAVLRAHGARPAAVLGHSVGEIAAAVVAGILTQDQGARLVCRRSALLRPVAGHGAMAMVGRPAGEAEARLAGTGVEVAIAASPVASVISGPVGAVHAVVERWAAEGVRCRLVDSDVAFHSAHMDEPAAELAAACADLHPAVPAVRVYSTALPDSRSTVPRDGAYWAANLRGRVRLAGAVEAAVADGHRLFLEVSAHPVVEQSIAETFDALGADDAEVTHTLLRHRPERENLLRGLGRLWQRGAPLDWAALWPSGRTVDLPVLAWRHRRFWYDGEPAARSFLTEQHDPATHHLLGGRINVHAATLARAWLTVLDHDSRPYPGNHPVRGVEIVPAAVLLTTFLTAAAATTRRPVLEDVVLRLPVSLTASRYVQVVLQDDRLRLSTRIADDHDELGWSTHATASVTAGDDLTPIPLPPSLPSGYVPAGGDRLDPGHVVNHLADLGVAAMGFPWRIEDLRRGDHRLTATVDVGEPGGWGPMLDAALSVASVAFDGPPTLRMPAGIGRVTLGVAPGRRARVTVHHLGDDTLRVDVSGPDGTPFGRLDRLRYGTLDRDSDAVVDPRDLVHEIAWAGIEAVRHPVPARVTLVGPPSAALDRLTVALRQAGVEQLTIADPADLTNPADPADLNDLNDPADMTDLTDPTDLTGPLAAEAGPIVLLPGAGADGEAAASAAWLLAQAVKRLPPGARLWCVTVGVREAVQPETLGHAPLWGLARIIAEEHPALWGGLVDVGDDPADHSALAGLLGGRLPEAIVAIRGGRVTVPRLRRPAAASSGPPLVCRPDGTYLITGGLGALGLEAARWLADRGARRIVLAGRNTPPPRDGWDRLTDARDPAVVDAIRALERLGVTVVTVPVDVADPHSVAKLLSPAALGLPPIRGVVHAAGVLDNRMVRGLDEQSLRTVLRPKVEGALTMHGLFPPGELDFFVLFSSCGGLLGLPGQASYAAGNAYLDALAEHRRAAGDTGALSLAWTSWRGLGMSTSSEVIDLELAARGAADVTAAQAFAAWELADRHDLGTAVVLRVLPEEPGARRPAVLGELRPPAAAPASPAAAEWRALPADELRAYLLDCVRGEIVTTTGLAPAEVDGRRTMSDLGLDSVMTVRIRRGLERRLGVSLPATLFWERPSVDAIAGLLVELAR